MRKLNRPTTEVKQWLLSKEQEIKAATVVEAAQEFRVPTEAVKVEAHSFGEDGLNMNVTVNESSDEETIKAHVTRPFTVVWKKDTADLGALVIRAEVTSTRAQVFDVSIATRDAIFDPETVHNNLVAALGQDVLDAVSDEAFSIAEAYHFALANGFTELPYTEAVENTREWALMRLAQAN